VKLARRTGANMRSLRESRGLSPEALSSRSGIPLSAVVLFENGAALPDLRQLVAIADVLGTTPGAILAGVRWDQNQMRFEVDAPPGIA
jgi:transcriptional regulator with XRE-family HTH domain